MPNTYRVCTHPFLEILSLESEYPLCKIIAFQNNLPVIDIRHPVPHLPKFNVARTVGHYIPFSSKLGRPWPAKCPLNVSEVAASEAVEAGLLRCNGCADNSAPCASVGK